MVKFNNIDYKLKGVIVHKGDSIENKEYIRILQHIGNLKEYSITLKLINQAYLLLFEKKIVAPYPSGILNAKLSINFLLSCSKLRTLMPNKDMMDLLVKIEENNIV